MRMLFEMSDAELDRQREILDNRLMDEYYGTDFPKCRQCVHYIASCRQCERENEDEDDYVYAYVNPDDDACDDFEADEYYSD